MTTPTKAVILTVSAIVGAVAALVAIAVTANKMSPDSTTLKAQQDLLDSRIKREAQYQKCVTELWPVMQARMPYDGTGKDPLTGRTFQEAYLHTLKDQVIDLCSARGVK